MDQEKSKHESASSQVFISYKREDSSVARSLRQALRAEGVTVWWDEELRTGDRWDERIDAVLSTTDAVVVLWSEASIHSDWVRYEASIGRIQENLAHARIDGSEIPAPFRSIHMEDLSGWNGREDDPSFQRFLQAIRAIRQRRLKAKRIRYIRLWAVMLLVILLGLGSGWMLHTSFGKPEIAAVDSNPVELTISNKEASKAIRRVYVPTFTSTVVNTGGATDGDYLDGLADLFAAKLSALYDTEFVRLDPKREPGFAASMRGLGTKAGSYGVLVGRVHKYQDERPDIGQKAAVSIVVSLFDQNGSQAWIASQTISASTAKPVGNPPLGGVEAIELVRQLSAEIVSRLTEALQ